jgi:hypothetical protein
LEGGRKKMSEGGCEQNAGTEMADEEEEPRRDAEAREFCGNKWEGTSGSADEEDHEDTADM